MSTRYRSSFGGADRRNRWTLIRGLAQRIGWDFREAARLLDWIEEQLNAYEQDTYERWRD